MSLISEGLCFLFLFPGAPGDLRVCIKPHLEGASGKPCEDGFITTHYLSLPGSEATSVPSCPLPGADLWQGRELF